MSRLLIRMLLCLVFYMSAGSIRLMADDSSPRTFIDGKAYINYIATRLRFKCDWHRRLFSSGYTTEAEMVMVDRLDNVSEGISHKMAFGKTDIFADEVDNYWDPDFWADYNIIEPTETLDKAVDRLRKANAGLKK